jgi:hypothetical protein
VDLVDHEGNEGAGCWDLDSRQALSDLAVLRNFSGHWGSEWADISELLEKTSARIHGKVGKHSNDVVLERQ